MVMADDHPSHELESREPTVEELQALRIAPEEDLYAPLLRGVPWVRE